MISQTQNLFHYNIIITGKVQRIGFRFLAMQMAIKCGVSGFVKYLDVDKIYMEAEGTEVQLQCFIKWCKNGPPGAIITQVSIEKASLKNLESFEIFIK